MIGLETLETSEGIYLLVREEAPSEKGPGVYYKRAFRIPMPEDRTREAIEEAIRVAGAGGSRYLVSVGGPGMRGKRRRPAPFVVDFTGGKGGGSIGTGTYPAPPSPGGPPSPFLSDSVLDAQREALRSEAEARAAKAKAEQLKWERESHRGGSGIDPALSERLSRIEAKLETTGRGEGTRDLLAVLMQESRRRDDMFLALLQRQEKKNPLEEFAAVASLLREMGGGGGTTTEKLAEFRAFLEVAREIGGGGGEEPSELGLVLRAVTALKGPAEEPAPKAPAPQATPAIPPPRSKPTVPNGAAVMQIRVGRFLGIVEREMLARTDPEGVGDELSQAFALLPEEVRDAIESLGIVSAGEVLSRYDRAAVSRIAAAAGANPKAADWLRSFQAALVSDEEQDPGEGAEEG